MKRWLDDILYIKAMSANWVLMQVVFMRDTQNNAVFQHFFKFNYTICSLCSRVSAWTTIKSDSTFS